MNTPLVSVLLVTEDRPEFRPWVKWNFRRQTYPNRELIVIDSSFPPVWNTSVTLSNESERIAQRVYRAPHGTSVPQKYNQALDEAKGDIIMFWGDDDWQHPQRIEWTVEALEKKDLNVADRPTIVGWSHGWFVDLWTNKCSFYRCGKVTASTVGIRTEVAKMARFDEALSHASDTRWLNRILETHKAKALERDQTHGLWLVHGRNMSQRMYRWTHTLDAVSKFIEPQYWNGTLEQLDALRGRLQ